MPFILSLDSTQTTSGLESFDETDRRLVHASPILPSISKSDDYNSLNTIKSLQNDLSKQYNDNRELNTKIKKSEVLFQTCNDTLFINNNNLMHIQTKLNDVSNLISNLKVNNTNLQSLLQLKADMEIKQNLYITSLEQNILEVKNISEIHLAYMTQSNTTIHDLTNKVMNLKKDLHWLLVTKRMHTYHIVALYTSIANLTLYNAIVKCNQSYQTIKTDSITETNKSARAISEDMNCIDTERKKAYTRITQLIDTQLKQSNISLTEPSIPPPLTRQTEKQPEAELETASDSDNPLKNLWRMVTKKLSKNQPNSDQGNHQSDQGNLLIESPPPSQQQQKQQQFASFSDEQYAYLTLSKDRSILPPLPPPPQYIICSVDDLLCPLTHRLLRLRDMYYTQLNHTEIMSDPSLLPVPEVLDVSLIAACLLMVMLLCHMILKLLFNQKSVLLTASASSNSSGSDNSSSSSSSSSSILLMRKYEHINEFTTAATDSHTHSHSVVSTDTDRRPVASVIITHTSASTQTTEPTTTSSSSTTQAQQQTQALPALQQTAHINTACTITSLDWLDASVSVPLAVSTPPPPQSHTRVTATSVLSEVFDYFDSNASTPRHTPLSNASKSLKDLPSRDTSSASLSTAAGGCGGGGGGGRMTGTWMEDDYLNDSVHTAATDDFENWVTVTTTPATTATTATTASGHHNRATVGISPPPPQSKQKQQHQQQQPSMNKSGELCSPNNINANTTATSSSPLPSPPPRSHARTHTHTHLMATAASAISATTANGVDKHALSVDISTPRVNVSEFDQTPRMNVSEFDQTPRMNVSEFDPTPRMNVSEFDQTPRVNVSEFDQTPRVNVSEFDPTPRVNVSDFDEKWMSSVVAAHSIHSPSVLPPYTPSSSSSSSYQHQHGHQSQQHQHQRDYDSSSNSNNSSSSSSGKKPTMSGPKKPSPMRHFHHHQQQHMSDLDRELPTPRVHSSSLSITTTAGTIVDRMHSPMYPIAYSPYSSQNGSMYGISSPQKDDQQQTVTADDAGSGDSTPRLRATTTTSTMSVKSTTSSATLSSIQSLPLPLPLPMPQSNKQRQQYTAVSLDSSEAPTPRVAVSSSHHGSSSYNLNSYSLNNATTDNDPDIDLTAVYQDTALSVLGSSHRLSPLRISTDYRSASRDGSSSQQLTPRVGLNPVSRSIKTDLLQTDTAAAVNINSSGNSNGHNNNNNGNNSSSNRSSSYIAPTGELDESVASSRSVTPRVNRSRVSRSSTPRSVEYRSKSNSLDSLTSQSTGYTGGTGYSHKQWATDADGGDEAPSSRDVTPRLNGRLLKEDGLTHSRSHSRSSRHTESPMIVDRLHRTDSGSRSGGDYDYNNDYGENGNMSFEASSREVTPRRMQPSSRSITPGPSHRVSATKERDQDGRLTIINGGISSHEEDYLLTDSRSVTPRLRTPSVRPCSRSVTPTLNRSNYQTGKQGASSSRSATPVMVSSPRTLATAMSALSGGGSVSTPARRMRVHVDDTYSSITPPLYSPVSSLRSTAVAVAASDTGTVNSRRINTPSSYIMSMLSASTTPTSSHSSSNSNHTPTTPFSSVTEGNGAFK